MSAKENDADILHREYLRRERELAPQSRFGSILLTVIFCVILGGGAILHLITPDREYSEAENRRLQTLPEFSLESLASGKYTSEVTKYLSDQFPARDAFVTLKAASETALLRRENGGIMISGDWLVARNDYPSRDNLGVNADAAEKFAAALGSRGIPTVAAIAGRTADVAAAHLPTLYGTAAQDELWRDINSAFSGFGGTYLNLRDTVADRLSAGEDVVFRTDHHWNALGAYYAYRAIMEALPESAVAGVTPRGIDYFTRECVTEEFYGTSYSKSGASWVAPDKIKLFRFPRDENLTVTVADTGESHTGLYYTDYLSVRDKYSVFLGENAGRVDITGESERPKIVLVKDSFAQSIAPFFAADFDVVLIDPRYFSAPVYTTVIEENAAAVVILMNADAFTSSPVLRALPRGTDR